MSKTIQKHNSRIKKALESDNDYANLKENNEEYQKLIQTILKIDENNLKDLIELEPLDKNEIQYYKKNHKEFAEYYLTI